VAYARDGDTLLVSTPGFTFKRKAIAQDPRITLCITSNAEPFNFVSVEGDAQIETDNLVEDTRKVFNNIKDTGFDEPADLPAWLASQQRVIIRLKPKRVYGVIR
jgi:general stress protein 26